MLSVTVRKQWEKHLNLGSPINHCIVLVHESPKYKTESEKHSVGDRNKWQSKFQPLAGQGNGGKIFKAGCGTLEFSLNMWARVPKWAWVL